MMLTEEERRRITDKYDIEELCDAVDIDIDDIINAFEDNIIEWWLTEEYYSVEEEEEDQGMGVTIEEWA